MKKNKKEELDVLQTFFEKIKQIPQLQPFWEGKEKEQYSFALYGLSEGAKSALASFFASEEKGLCLLFSDELKMRKSYQEFLEEQGFSILRAREEQRSGSKQYSYVVKQEQERLYLLGKLALRRPVKIAVTPAIFFQVLPDLEHFRQSIFSLNLNEKMSPLELEKNLLSLGYEKKSLLDGQGQFARRGDIVDVWPIGLQEMLEDSLAEDSFAFVLEEGNIKNRKQKLEELRLFSEKWKEKKEHLALRFSFFDEEIDSAKWLDSDSQRSLEQYFFDEILLFPAKELRFPSDLSLQKSFVEEVKKDLAKLKKQGESLTENNLMKITGQKLLSKHLKEQEEKKKKESCLEEQVAFLEQALPNANLHPWLYLLFQYPLFFTEKHADMMGADLLAEDLSQFQKPCVSLWAYLSHLPLIIEDVHSLEGAFSRVEESLMLQLSQAIFKEEITRLYPHNFFESAKLWQELVEHRQKICFSLLPFSKKEQGLFFQQEISLKTRDLPLFQGQENLLREELQQLPPFYEIFVSDTREEIQENLKKIQKNLRFLPTVWQQGFVFESAALVLLGHEQLESGKRANKKKRRSKKYTLDLFSGLKPGDYVVHDLHGIARYEGLATLEKDGCRRDYLHLAYSGEASLYIPMEALDQVQKYVSVGSEKAPKLSKLGSGDWHKLKERARESSKTLATNLVKLYAERMKQKGFVFEKDASLEASFAEKFPFVETEDQLRSMEEIEKDMCSTKCMDRLLCGDVGFGKTEVAFRALFKCALNGKQAVFLSPTTVLANQHYQNLAERLRGFPLRVAQLSRFVKASEQKLILQAVKEGKIDILVGTHRAFSKDVEFKDLGLLVVDEEQRFGVDHKETLKEKYPLIDVLSLSATPIPRTLHMGLAGIRDISVLQEAPVDRKAIMTYVLPYEEALIMEAIEREIAREGQVFYLYNHTEKIYKKAERLQELMPSLRIAIAHGKMSEQGLEKEIQAFLNKEYDLLLCTTIIESGIDMPNVNTLIVEKADRLGLAQMYQLRGRVGRSLRQAYAYLTYEKEKILSEQAQKRLASISDYTELGSGFKIAMRDLEARGAGNVLGAEQHGQLEAVGYELYCRMLEEEITNAKESLDLAKPEAPLLDLYHAERALPVSEVLIDLKLDAYIPKNYIYEEAERMDMYRRIAGIQSEEDYQDCLDELWDRYGEPSEMLMSLLAISYLRVQAAKLKISLVSQTEQGVQFLFAKKHSLPLEKIAHFMDLLPYKHYFQLYLADARPRLLYNKNIARPTELVLHLYQMFKNFETKGL